MMSYVIELADLTNPIFGRRLLEVVGIRITDDGMFGDKVAGERLWDRTAKKSGSGIR